jgi:uncharacterized protein
VKRGIANVLALCLVGLAGARALGAEEKKDESSAARKLRVLVVTGGHGFQVAPFYQMFDRMTDVEYRQETYPKAAELLKPGLEQVYDAIVMYDMVGSITPDQQKAFVELLNAGIGLVLLHHDLGAHRDWPEFTKIRGGKFFFKPETVDGKGYGASSFKDDQKVKVLIADHEHPITKGLQDYEIQDEIYGKCYVSPDVRVLLKTDHPLSCPALAWVHEYGKSKVFYLMSGHDSKAWNNPSFFQELQRGIHWAAGK